MTIRYRKTKIHAPVNVKVKCRRKSKAGFGGSAGSVLALGLVGLVYYMFEKDIEDHRNDRIARKNGERVRARGKLHGGSADQAT